MNSFSANSAENEKECITPEVRKRTVDVPEVVREIIEKTGEDYSEAAMKRRKAVLEECTAIAGDGESRIRMAQDAVRKAARDQMDLYAAEKERLDALVSRNELDAEWERHYLTHLAFSVVGINYALDILGDEEGAVIG